MKRVLTCILLMTVVFGARADIFATNVSDKDAFLRALAPNANYGGGGALSVSGTNAANSTPTNGAFDSFMSFNAAPMASNFDAQFGAGNWVVTGASLNLTLNPTPGNPVFNVGNGSFAVWWLANDSWIEGTGTPMAPTTDGITYGMESNYCMPGLDASVGVFAYNGAARMTYPLTLVPGLVTNILAGGEVGFWLTAASDTIGYIFYSHNFKGNPSALPTLVISAAAAPVTLTAAPSGSNLILTGTHGQGGTTNVVLGSADLIQWSSVQTNVLTSGGTFQITLTNAISAGAMYYILQTQ